ncbi:hypothetical protein PILCRDRAFT_3414 [Piloderma croceum F 1598]|uniref:Uncharacterized protein n=1 Tax=Piloderma croceum (strain F 1598) TaxID=765440 RepID=A0A0C3G9J8_PILCF|nr:hypothetical protein PILCRDRAFT_3414 [Piloderma croceum F 1598]
MPHTRTTHPTPQQASEAARALASALGESVSYAIVGGAACSLLGSLRQTEDIDFVVPQGGTPNARSLLRQSANFNVQPRTNYTTYFFALPEVEPIDIEILTPPSLFKGEYTAQSPIVFVGEIRVLHPIDILASKCDSVIQRSTAAKRSSDSNDIAFLLDYIIKHEDIRGEAELGRLRKVATKEWIQYYLQNMEPDTEESWVKLGLYTSPTETS